MLFYRFAPQRVCETTVQGNYFVPFLKILLHSLPNAPVPTGESNSGGNYAAQGRGRSRYRGSAQSSAELVSEAKNELKLAGIRMRAAF